MRPALWLTLGMTLAASSGCASTTAVRYVYQDGNFGVVGMPENTNRFPYHYRTKAERLMAEHFPDGHEIVRAEEVNQGERTLKIDGGHTAELAPQASSGLLSVAKLGRTSSRSQADTTKIKECRIIYRRIGSPEVPAGFSAAADPTPTQYIDPNAAERHRIATGGEDSRKIEEGKKLADARTDDAQPHPSPQDGG